MSEKAAIPDATQRPGPLLKQARESLQLSQKDIANQLNLQTDIIEAVEQDQLDRLPAATYVRGYIRSYARIVKLDADEMIRLFDNESMAPPEIIPDSKSSGQASSHDKPVRAMTYLVTFGLALLLIAWLQSNYVVDKETPDAESSGSANADAMVEEPQAAPTDSVSSLYFDEQLAAPAVDEQINNTMALSGAQQEFSDETMVEEDVSLLPDQSSITEESSTDPAAVAGETFADGQDRLQLKLAEESWIEVYDSGNNRLYLGLARAGEEISLSGIAPFSVLLGYAPAVDVIFNGRPFDPEPHSNAGIARFTLGADDPQN